MSSSVPKRTRQMKRKNRRPKKKKVKEGVFPKVGKEKEYDQARRRETAKEKGKRGKREGEGRSIKTSRD